MGCSLAEVLHPESTAWTPPLGEMMSMMSMLDDFVV